MKHPLAVCLTAAMVIFGCSGGGGFSGDTGRDMEAPADGGQDQGQPDVPPSDDEKGESGDAAVDTGPDESYDPGPPLPTEVDYLIVAANGLADSAAAFAGYRQETGYVAEMATLADLGPSLGDYDESTVVELIRDRVRQAWEKRDVDRPFYLLILGDAQYSQSDVSALVPAPYEPVGWDPGHSDNGYADMDGDHVPDLAVGRIPVRTNEDALLVLDKVKHHEAYYEVGPWNRRLSAYAGEGGFGSDIDSAIELAVQKVFESLSYDYDIAFAFNSPDSVYYFKPFRDKVLEYLTQGSILTAYMGHGGGETNVVDLSLIQCQHRCPVLAFFACGTGDFLMPGDSDPEILMKQAGAPFEFLASQPASHPYGNAILARELEIAVLELRVATYGEAVREMKWRTIYNDDEFRQLVDAMAALFITADEMEAVRLSHMYTYNLLGDPALAIRYPEQGVALETMEGKARAGTDLAFTGTVSGFETGSAHLTLEVNRLTIPWDLEPVPPQNDPGYEAVIQANHGKAMNKVMASIDVPVTDGAFAGVIGVPADMPPGMHYLKVMVDDGAVDGIGHCAVHVVSD